MKHLYFVRHGESELNVKQIFAGQTDTPLTARGEDQAKLAGAQAKALNIDVVVSSPLVRALKTAQIIAAEIGYPEDKIITNDVFKERSLGSLEGKSWNDTAEDETLVPDIETEDALLARAQAGLTYLQNIEGAVVLLVGHGSFSRALRTAIDPTTNSPEPENAELVQLI